MQVFTDSGNVLKNTLPSCTVILKVLSAGVGGGGGGDEWVLSPNILF